MKVRLFACLVGLAFSSIAAIPEGNLLNNGGFESGLRGWRTLWTRQPGTGAIHLDQQFTHSGTNSVRLEHSGEGDWSFEPDLRLAVEQGSIFELAAWVRLPDSSSANLCLSTWNAQGQIVNWSYAERAARAGKDWTLLRSRFVVPRGVAQIQPRLIGSGNVTVWLDDFSLVRQPGVETARAQSLPPHLGLTNEAVGVSLDTSDATLSVLDRRTGRIWTQKCTEAGVIVTGAKTQGNQLELNLLHVASTAALMVTLQLDRAQPEFSVKIAGTGELPAPLNYPYPFVTQAGDRLIVPMNEGISYPVEDQTLEPFRLIAYGGHGICMAFWGVTDDQQGQGHAVIIETADDAAIRMQRLEGRLVIAPEWDAQHRQFGYPRRLRYVFFDRGGYVAIAKRYRQHAQDTCLLKTLAEKRKANPNIDLLVGAVNVWNWDSDPVAITEELQAAGIQRILWSRGGSPEALRELNEKKVLTSRYDIYQDVMDPANFPKLNGLHKDWTTAAWPNDIIWRADGDWLRGWGVKGKQDEWYSCGVLCDRRALEFARQRIPAELAASPYRCRFIDTTTAAPWNECYHTNHPMTRSDSREWKMKLLDAISREFNLVTGSETGHDAAVPYVHYFEGMLSLGPYRVPDSGRNMQRIWTEVPERVAKFQLGHRYRLPLWELVYHDCVVAQWYWGDYNNKLPSLWDKRDRFNVLYGTPPMFMFDRKLWQAQKERFVQSYQDTCPYVRASGYEEMTEHRCLTPDRDVQQSTFANGVQVTVNFGEAPYRLPSGAMLKPMGFLVTGMPNEDR